ncbi:MAG: DNA-processing protein DprA [Tepidisphaerales bacterium]
MATHHWLQLSLAAGLGPVLVRRIVERAGSAEAACAMKGSDLREIEGIGTARSSSIAESLRAAAGDVHEQLDAAEKLGAMILTPDSPEYPELLKQIYDPPVVLFCRGTFEPRDLFAVAIVGSRRCSIYGREQAERFGSLLAGVGITVISGGARGVDSAAHRGALRHPAGRTFAVLGSGLDQPYPRENAPLFDQLATRGCVMSEYAFGTPPEAQNFPRRNRIISGLSRGVLVIEADERSGALITARVAADDHNRPVFAIPGRIDNPMASGTNQIIRDGATLVTKLDDILAELGPLPDSVIGSEPPQPSVDATQPAPAASSLTPIQSQVFAALSVDPMTIDQLVDATNLDAGTLLSELTFLSLKALVRRVDGQAFQRRSH